MRDVFYVLHVYLHMPSQIQSTRSDISRDQSNLHVSFLVRIGNDFGFFVVEVIKLLGGFFQLLLLFHTSSDNFQSTSLNSKVTSPIRMCHL